MRKEEDMFPKLNLCIDNCFAYKRWTKPGEWMRVIADLGIKFVEASADTECDPLYQGEEYIAWWVDETRRQSEKTGVAIKNVYSGHGTYCTLGLAHTNAAAREYFKNKWVKRQAQVAKDIGAGFGFYNQALCEDVLQSPAKYRAAMDTLLSDLQEIALYGREIGVDGLSLEQMYTPHMPPWTIREARQFVRDIYRCGAPMYLTVDTGHMNGQQYFLRPSQEQVREWIERRRSGEQVRRIWLGPKTAYDVFNSAVKGGLDSGEAATRIAALQEDYGYLFAEPEDTLIENWFRALGRYASIVHVQQADAKSSPHWSFTPENNAKGIVDGRSVLKALAEAFNPENEAEALPPLREINVTIEAFVGTAANIYDVLAELEQSVAYWRKLIPYDGIPLDEAVARLNP